MPRLPMRLRKLIGMIVMVAFVVLYALLAMMLAATRLPGSPIWVQTIYYAVAGLAWTVPCALLIRWMQRPDEAPDPRRR